MKNDNFNELMKQFKNLSLDDKKSILIDKAKKIINMMLIIGKMYNKEINILYSQEIENLNYLHTEADYIEAFYAYIHILEDTIVQLLDEN